MTSSHWYAFYAGDYARDTSHLTMTEHGAYRLMLDHYFSTRQPLPASPQQLHRICRAFGEQEQNAVQAVAEQFFRKDGPLLRNKRADAELAKQAEISRKRSKAAKCKAKTGRANAKQMQSRSTAHAHTTTATTTSQEESYQEEDSHYRSDTPAWTDAPDFGAARA